MAELKQSDLESLKNIVTEFEGKLGKQLGTELYHLCSALMPSVNVDVMVRNTSGILLCWRHDNFYGPGWHVRVECCDTRRRCKNELKRS